MDKTQRQKDYNLGFLDGRKEAIQNKMGSYEVAGDVFEEDLDKRFYTAEDSLKEVALSIYDGNNAEAMDIHGELRGIIQKISVLMGRVNEL